MKTTPFSSNSVLANTSKTGVSALIAFTFSLRKQWLSMARAMVPDSLYRLSNVAFSTLLVLLLLLAGNTSQAGIPSMPPTSNPLNTQAGLPKTALHTNLNASRTRLSQQEAIVIAEDEYEGRALGVKRVPGSGGTAYRVRILKANGKVKNVLVQGSLQ